MGTCTNWLMVSWMMLACWDNSKPVDPLPVRQFFLKMLSSMSVGTGKARCRD